MNDIKFTNQEADYLRNKLQTVCLFLEKRGDVPTSFIEITKKDIITVLEELDDFEHGKRFRNVIVFLTEILDLLENHKNNKQIIEAFNSKSEKYFKILSLVFNDRKIE